jgi:hypothetical protein
MDLAIYGAQGLALGAYRAICDLLPLRTIRCFLVTKQDINSKTLSGIPVLELKAFADMLSDREKTEIEVLIATPEDVMTEIEKCLDECGLRCHARLTSFRWAELMGYHVVREKRFMTLSAVPIGYHKAELHVFMTKSYKDKPLSNQYNISEWITPIQVGTALYGKAVDGLSDDEGNIVMEILGKLYPEKMSVFSNILHQQYFYNYNIIIAHGKRMSIQTAQFVSSQT